MTTASARWVAIAHHLPERTRLRSPLLRRDVAACERVAEVLAKIQGVREVRVRPYTGSALVVHDRDVTADWLAAAAKTALACDVVLAIGQAPPISTEIPAFSELARKLATSFHDLDDELRKASDGTIDVGTMLTFSFLGLSAAEIAATGKLPLPPWSQLAWWAFRTFVTMEQDEIEAVLLERKRSAVH